MCKVCFLCVNNTAHLNTFLSIFLTYRSDIFSWRIFLTNLSDIYSWQIRYRCSKYKKKYKYILRLWQNDLHLNQIEIWQRIKETALNLRTFCIHFPCFGGLIVASLIQKITALCVTGLQMKCGNSNFRSYGGQVCRTINW